MPRGGSSQRGSSTSRGGKPYRGRGGQRGGRRNRDLLGDAPQTNGTGFKGFSMTDEARNTTHHTGHWDASSGLRKKPVSFISAGPIEPLKELEGDLNPTGDEADQQDQHQPSPPTIEVAEAKVSDEYKRESSLDAPNDEAQDDADESLVIGPDELEQDILKATQSDTKHTADATEAPFFFDLKGDRKAGFLPNSSVPIPSRSPEHDSGSSSDEVILFRGRDATPIRQPSKPAVTTGSTSITLTQMETEIRAVEEDLSIPRGRGPVKKGKAKGKGKAKRTQAQMDRRMQSSDDDDAAAIVADYLSNMRESGELSDLLTLQIPDTRNTRDLGGSDREMYDGEPEASVSDPKVPKQVKQGSQSGSYESGSELDDATLAKLLQGHIPGPEEEVVFNEFTGLSSDSSDIDDGPAYGQGKRQKWETEDFDMDWERPSLLQKKKKGKAARAQIALGVSDDDLQETMLLSLDNSRLKKSARKQQREELRALGMLGRHASKPEDLRVKYPAGMDLQQVGEEIKIFLKGGDETLTMPPMDTHARKVVHEIANKFKIKSKSTGKADQRRTSLYRTKRTLQFSENSFDQTVARIHRRFLPRLDVKGKRGSKAPPQRSNHGAASYQEGEVVGAAAPELGSGNRGRAMLEKMGWSTGTALGAVDNKGILQPVPQTMKKSKAGLG